MCPGHLYACIQPCFKRRYEGFRIIGVLPNKQSSILWFLGFYMGSFPVCGNHQSWLLQERVLSTRPASLDCSHSWDLLRELCRILCLREPMIINAIFEFHLRYLVPLRTLILPILPLSPLHIPSFHFMSLYPKPVYPL